MCTGRVSPPIPNGPPRLPTTELSGRSGHHSRLGFAPRIARSEPKPRAGRRRRKGEMAQPKLATLLHKARRSRCFYVGDQVLRFSAELVDFLRLSQVLNERFFMLVVLELLDHPLDFVLACCTLLLDCRKRVRNFSSRLMVPKMILRLGFVDLADHIASSILTRLVALSELSEPSGGAHPKFSYIPLSQCKRQAVCR